MYFRLLSLRLRSPKLIGGLQIRALEERLEALQEEIEGVQTEQQEAVSLLRDGLRQGGHLPGPVLSITELLTAFHYQAIYTESCYSGGGHSYQHQKLRG